MFDLNMSILDPEYGEELDEGRLNEYINGLMAEFEQSPEAVAFMQEFDTSLCWPNTYMHYAAQYYSATPATVTSGETEDILFNLFPQKVVVEADAAHEIIAELRAFWKFLRRTRTLAEADSILELLTDDNADRLEAELADPDNFSMGKTFYTQGKLAGYDMTNETDLARFALAYNASLGEHSQGPSALSDSRDTPDAPPVPTATAPFRRAEARVGRNDPCPCGSGNKFKRCCGREL